MVDPSAGSLPLTRGSFSSNHANNCGGYTYTVEVKETFPKMEKVKINGTEQNSEHHLGEKTFIEITFIPSYYILPANVLCTHTSMHV